MMYIYTRRLRLPTSSCRAWTLCRTKRRGVYIYVYMYIHIDTDIDIYMVYIYTRRLRLPRAASAHGHCAALNGAVFIYMFIYIFI